MIPVSSTFLAAVKGSHSIAVRVRVCPSGQTGTDPDGTEIPVTDGEVEFDAGADIRATVDVTTTRPWPSASDPLLLPYGNELFVERGVIIAGSTEWCPLGYFRIEGPDQDRAPDWPLSLVGMDRMATIRDSQLTAPRWYPSAMTWGAAVEDLILDVYPSAVIEWDDATETQPIGRIVDLCPYPGHGTVHPGVLTGPSLRFAGLRDLMASIGKIAYFDHRGVLVIKDLPDTSVPVAEIHHGDGGVLIQLSRQLSRRAVVNAVVAEGESATTDTPVRVTRIDNNPTSPTYWFGSFGKIPRFYSSPLLTTLTQARKAADTILKRSIGLPYTVDFKAVPNPALQPLDPVTVTYDDDSPAETHVLQRLTIPLTATEGMAADTREQTVVIIADG